MKFFLYRGYFRIARDNCEFDLTPFYPQLANLNDNNDDEEESEKGLIIIQVYNFLDLI